MARAILLRCKANSEPYGAYRKSHDSCTDKSHSSTDHRNTNNADPGSNIVFERRV